MRHKLPPSSRHRVERLPAHRPVPLRAGLHVQGGQARAEVTKNYQWLVRHDFLPRIIDENILKAQYSDAAGTSAQPFLMPLEFSAAAYRFGHAMVRRTYGWNRIFNSGTPAFHKKDGRLTGVGIVAQVFAEATTAAKHSIVKDTGWRPTLGITKGKFTMPDLIYCAAGKDACRISLLDASVSKPQENTPTLPNGVVVISNSECPPRTLGLWKDRGRKGRAYGIGAGYPVDLSKLPTDDGDSMARNVSSWVNRTESDAKLVGSKGICRVLKAGEPLEESNDHNDTVEWVKWV
ncbi:hypothetical protein Sfulv_00690 [Streptomyces fulvorobeus]|uniref:Uncharacterized protein n=1 Tax=Streptomyces fulvorobeus TaxID=284028 RepID=A0A7J0BYE7_9ACTN|nr:hypothetical protein Sfulv_00690 [Streptomyces fulvorobeus]